MTVAVGLALLVFMPLPFMRSMGVGGLLVPLVSIAASATLLPALLSLMGQRVNRWRVVPRRVLERRAATDETGLLAPPRHLDHAPPACCSSALAGGLMLALAVPALGLALTGGDNRGVPLTTESTHGPARARDDARAGRAGAAPDRRRHAPAGRRVRTRPSSRRSGGWWRRCGATARSCRETIAAPGLRAAPRRRARRTSSTPTGACCRSAPPGAPTPARTRRWTSSTASATATSRPRASRHRADVLLTGAPAFGVDFIDKAYGAFPWLVLAVLVVSYLLLLRAFRSVVLPAKAVIMNLLSVSATYGVLVLAFQHGWGEPFGLQQSDQIDGWIPIFLFAMLFGLSMDYEVFLLSRMREEWDRRPRQRARRSPTGSSTPAASSRPRRSS